jgi:two-component system cell cycle sensor histidine kinase/response regulator CckA
MKQASNLKFDSEDRSMHEKKEGMPSKKILVVEDENLIAMEIQDRLKALGYSVPAITNSGEEAIKLVPQINPDLILMDIMLDGLLDGIETAKSIYNQYDIPIVFLTAYSDDETLERAKRSSPYGYLIKPLEEREIYTTIEIALYKHTIEKRLKERERWLSTTLKSIGDAVMTTDEHGIITFMNQTAEALTGWKLEEAKGSNSKDIFTCRHENQHKALENPIKTVLEKRSAIELSNSSYFISKKKRAIPIHYNASPILDDHGILKGVVLVFRDVTERKELEEQLRQSQKLEAIGTLAGGVAHDFNNIMTSIQLGIDLSLMDMDPDNPAFSEIKKNMQDIHHSAAQAADLARQLLMFSRKHPMNPKLISINTLIQQSISMFNRLIGEDIKIDTVLEPNLWNALADQGTIEQVILNLVVNARDAMPSGGVLTITTENSHVNEEASKTIINAQPGKYVCFSVEDTGSGMDEETIDHIFEPFFSTKGPDKGTGLGLSVVYGIVKQHQGWIHVESALGEGTKFEVYLPAVQKVSAKKVNQKITKIQKADSGQKILVVEDEEKVRDFLLKALTRIGYSVLIAKDSEEACEIFKREEGNVHLILSDVVLPGINGVELVEQLIALKPNLRVLLCSGYTDDKCQWDKIVSKGYHFLDKPFTIDNLAKKVQEVMNN